jgi:hypothetical protein
MSSLTRCPNHLPTLMAVAGLYKARGMLDEARSALQLALQTAEAAAAAAPSSTNSSGGSGRSSSQGLAVTPAAAAAAAAAEDVDAGASTASGADASSSDVAEGSMPGQQQLQTQASNDGSALSDMSTSSSIVEGSGGSQAASRPGSACGTQAAAVAGTGAGAVPLATVKEALAVVLTDLGTRAKNAGVWGSHSAT